MEVNKKACTLKMVFFKYLVTLAVAFIITIGVYMLALNIGSQSGMTIVANYSEDLARQAKPILQSAEKITEDMIPYGCKFALFDKEYKVKKTNLEGQDLIAATEYAKGTYEKTGKQKSYYFIERKDGYCVLQYYVKVRYKSEFLNEHLPSPEIMMIAIFCFIYFFVVFIITTIYAKNLKKHLKPLLQATQKIKEQDLDFEVKYSGIKEFNDVILSIGDMKTELKKSLKEQWNLEQAKKEQISALAHDLKTPLTIIKGNADLLLDSTLDSEQTEYTHYISKNSGQMEKYIKTLIEISNSEKASFAQLEKIDFETFIDTIRSQIEGLANTKNLKVQFAQWDIPKEVMVDPSLLHRAIMNVISNAVDYSPNNAKIYFEVKFLDNKITFTITDCGKGFCSEDIKSATKQFYMGDRSRTSKVHFGIGLYITESIVNLHSGTLSMSNSPVTGGAQVSIEIPYLLDFRV